MSQTRPKAPPEARKAPQQARAIATCAAIVEASARILETDGPAGLTTNGIAERAGVSIGTLYQYYPDKQAIVVALIRRERAALLREIGCIQADDPQALETLIALSIRHQFQRPKLASALEVLEVTLCLEGEASAMALQIADLSSRLLRSRFGDVAQEDLLTAVLIGRALINAAGEGILPEEGLADRVGRAVAAYLGERRT